VFDIGKPTDGSVTNASVASNAAIALSKLATTGTMTFASTIGVGGATPAASGAGITFPASVSASTDANTLDDYEEGTFTPTIFGATTAGTGTYSTQAGAYTKIGNTVTISGFLVWSAHTGTGSMKMGGLPFTTNSNSNYASCFALSEIGNITTAANNILTLQTVNNTTDAFFGRTPVGGGGDAAVTLDTAGYFRFSTTYFV
jgi:hypothetical protein